MMLKRTGFVIVERERERGCCDREKEERKMRSQKEGEIEVMWRRRKLTKIITATT